MKRFFPVLTLAAALATPITALADMPRVGSPARQMLQQMMVLPAHRGDLHRRAHIAGDYTPLAVHTPRFGLIGLPSHPGASFSIRRNGHLNFSIGCNRFWADAHIRHDAFEIGPIASTRMACARRDARAERRMLRALRHADGVQARHGEIRFTDAQGMTVLILSHRQPLARPMLRHSR